MRYLWHRLVGSVAQRGWRGTWSRVAQEFSRPKASDDSLPLLELGYDTSGLVFSSHQAPQVSIVIPVYGKLDYTVTCLRSLAMYQDDTATEIIVVDDASSDGSAAVLAAIPGLRVIVNPCNVGFVGSCNAGAAVANGEYVVFLNNDTQVTSGWLAALLRCFAEEPDCGLAGSRLVYPDGRLQEAGGWVFNDGSAWNVGRFQPRNASAFRYRRRTDYISGASIMLRRDRFIALDGFDNRYAPAYYEDTDLAFAVRNAGLSVFYEPNSVVIHCEGITAGTDLGSGMKRYQTINQAKFLTKWRDVLATHPAPGAAPRTLWSRYSKGHIFIIDAMTPDPSRDSGSVRLCGILRILHAERWRLTFAPDDGFADDDAINQMGTLGTEVLTNRRSGDISRWLQQHGKDLHAVVLCRHAIAAQYADEVRRHAPQAKLILDTVDLHFLREQRAAELNHSGALRRQADISRRSELALIAQCDVTLVVSRHEQELLRNLAPASWIELLSNIHDVHDHNRLYAGRRDLVFIGGHGHPPNADALRWMASELLPTLRRTLADIRIHVLGDLPEAARALLRQPGLELHGRVPDLKPWLDTCIASIAPLRFGAGVKGKINTAMSHGVPVIATSVAIEGMHLRDGIDVLLADDAAAMVNAVQRLYEDEALWNRLSEAGLENIRRHFSVSAARDTLKKLLD